MRIIWTNKAFDSYQKNIEYLLEEWSIEVTVNFINETEKVEDLLKGNPNLGRFDEDLKLYKLLVIKQIYLFYEMDGINIVLINFWNNYKKPYWL